jgi:GyrI-like small molecule binding domain
VTLEPPRDQGQAADHGSSIPGAFPPEIRDLPGVDVAAVRLTVPRAELDLASLFARHLPLIAARLAQLGCPWAGPPFGRYHEWSEDRVVVEMGIPARSIGDLPTLDGIEAGEIGRSALPAGRAAVAVHRGPYTGLPAAWDRLRAAIRLAGLTPGAGPWESYVDAPEESALDAIRTEIIWPLAEAAPR